MPGPQAPQRPRNPGFGSPGRGRSRGGGTGTPRPGSGYDNLMQLLNQQQGGQYADLMSSVQAQMDQAKGLFAEFGKSQKASLDEQRQQRFATAEQQLIDRGLGNTTIRGSAQRGINADIDRQSLALDDMLLNRQSGLSQSNAAMLLQGGQFMPNIRDFAALMERFGGGGRQGYKHQIQPRGAAGRVQF